MTDTNTATIKSQSYTTPGDSAFNAARTSDKTKRVDLALVRRSDGWRVLISCKWSVRSDREEQFQTDFETYARLEADGEDFDYVLVTNEFDPARLAAACEMRRPNGALFTNVVHVNPEGPRQVYAVPTGRRGAGGIERTLGHIASDRLQGLDAWLAALDR